MEPGGLAEGEDGAQAAPLAPGGGSDPLPTLGLGFPICALKDLVFCDFRCYGKAACFQSRPNSTRPLGPPAGRRQGASWGLRLLPRGPGTPHEGGAGNFSDLKGDQGSRGQLGSRGLTSFLGGACRPPSRSHAQDAGAQGGQAPGLEGWNRLLGLWHGGHWAGWGL